MSQTSSEKNTIWRYGDCALELDMTDVETVERYESVFKRMENAQNTVPATGTHSEILRAYCQMFRDVFDGLFGTGTSQMLFGDKNNARVMTEAYENFLEFVHAQVSGLDELKNRITSRYSPNRAQRRAQK